MKDKKTMRWVTGMGDCIACSGAAVWLGWKLGKCVVPYQAYYERSVREIFANHPEVELMVLEDAIALVQERGSIPVEMQLLMHYDDDERETCGLDNYQWLYATHGVPYNERWESCPIPEARKLVEQVLPTWDEILSGGYVFWHDDPLRGMHLDSMKVGDVQYGPIFRPMLGYSILAYCEAIMGAAEVHVMDSAFFHLAEQLKPRGKLFLHHYAKGDYKPVVNDYETKHDWTIIR